MKISYNWLAKYLPEKIEPEKLSEILTSIGLEVESLEFYENIHGGLKGLIVGEVLTAEQHPNADKLKLTTVNVGKEVLQIVCGAPNVAAGQKVIVAPVSTTIFPVNNAPVTMKVAKIRGVESFGMICAEDEIGLGTSHAGIYILSDVAKVGDDASNYFNIYTDWIYEIGLTPNRMDAMSHIGVAKDVCAWLSYHNNKITKPNLPFTKETKNTNAKNEFEVIIENANDCKRYSGLYIKDVEIKESPDWLKNFLVAIGQRPINNVVDITNFVLHETGQPLHAFDADALTSKKVVIKNLPEGTGFKTLDDVERKLSSKDLMICNNDEPVCIAGVFGGIGSGVTNNTKNIFLESAWFSPSSIRQTSLKHGLRTEAAIRFEKGVDISGTVKALERAASLIKEIANGKIAGDVIDVYPLEIKKKNITLNYGYLKKLSGKTYEPSSVKNILWALGFEILNESGEEISVAVPLSKSDIALPADIVEEILRIDGLDNIDLSKSITITPAKQGDAVSEQLKEKIAQLLIGLGFNEIVTNSITNSKLFSERNLSNAVRLLNNLSEDLDIMRPTMLETGLEILAYNINRKNNNLNFFEFGKTYQNNNTNYTETEYLCFWITAKNEIQTWKQKIQKPDFFTAKGVIKNLFTAINIIGTEFSKIEETENGLQQKIFSNNLEIGSLTNIDTRFLDKFDIKQSVVFAELNYKNLLSANTKKEIVFEEIPQNPAVERDLAIVVDKNVKYATVEEMVGQLNLPFLQKFSLFDIFESDKIGKEKKSLAINFTFLNKERTLTDAEVNSTMEKIIKQLKNSLQAEIRNN
ncbi:MAG TPA: phenylalanine--tRNA ligase subunit beta [Parafilimonas sp.]|nr:phenylalanine--tRNA ligase subunit beta [Parafilimonas sp.]